MFISHWKIQADAKEISYHPSIRTVSRQHELDVFIGESFLWSDCTRGFKPSSQTELLPSMRDLAQVIGDT